MIEPFFLFLCVFHFDRYIDDIFMTTNQTLDEINQEIQKAQKKDVNIEIEHIIGTSVDYLDVTITNVSGHRVIFIAIYRMQLYCGQHVYVLILMTFIQNAFALICPYY